MPTISLCMIVKNEEKHLARCLDTVRDLMDEIIIVDTGSADRTKEIAARYTDRIYDFAWIDDFSAARNFAFSMAGCDYIYSADADEVLDEENHQGVAVVNYTDRETPYTRIIEHKHFEFGTQPKTVITREYPVTWQEGMEPYYPVNDEKNQALYQKYAKLAEKEEHVIFGGRLGEYKYYDMDKVIASAMACAKEELNML